MPYCVNYFIFVLAIVKSCNLYFIRQILYPNFYYSYANLNLIDDSYAIIYSVYHSNIALYLVYNSHNKNSIPRIQYINVSFVIMSIFILSIIHMQIVISFYYS